MIIILLTSGSLLGSGLILYCLRAVLLLGSAWINPILLTSGSPFGLWTSLIIIAYERLSFWALDEHYYNIAYKRLSFLGSGLILYCLRASSLSYLNEFYIDHERLPFGDLDYYYIAYERFP